MNPKCSIMILTKTAILAKILGLFLDEKKLNQEELLKIYCYLFEKEKQPFFSPDVEVFDTVVYLEEMMVIHNLQSPEELEDYYDNKGKQIKAFLAAVIEETAEEEITSSEMPSFLFSKNTTYVFNSYYKKCIDVYSNKQDRSLPSIRPVRELDVHFTRRLNKAIVWFLYIRHLIHSMKHTIIHINTNDLFATLRELSTVKSNLSPVMLTHLTDTAKIDSMIYRWLTQMQPLSRAPLCILGHPEFRYHLHAHSPSTILDFNDITQVAVGDWVSTAPLTNKFSLFATEIRSNTRKLLMDMNSETGLQATIITKASITSFRDTPSWLKLQISLLKQEDISKRSTLQSATHLALSNAISIIDYYHPHEPDNNSAADVSDFIQLDQENEPEKYEYLQYPE